MKLCVVSDAHLDWVTHGVRRFPEIAAAFDETIEAALDEGCSGYVFLGDLCDPDSGSCVFRVLEVAIRTALRLAACKIPSIWIAGNHDTIEDGTKDTSLSPLRALYGDRTPVHVFEEPGTCVLREAVDRDDHRDVWIAALPFTSASHPYDPASVSEKLLMGKDPRNVVVAGHLHVPGVEPGEETREMPRGREVWLPVDVLKPRASVILNGHYHRQQKTESGVWIPGSLARLTFCEENNHPGYLIVEV